MSSETGSIIENLQTNIGFYPVTVSVERNSGRAVRAGEPELVMKGDYLPIKEAVKTSTALLDEVHEEINPSNRNRLSRYLQNLLGNLMKTNEDSKIFWKDVEDKLSTEWRELSDTESVGEGTIKEITHSEDGENIPINSIALEVVGLGVGSRFTLKNIGRDYRDEAQPWKLVEGSYGEEEPREKTIYFHGDDRRIECVLDENQEYMDLLSPEITKYHDLLCSMHDVGDGNITGIEVGQAEMLSGVRKDITIKSHRAESSFLIPFRFYEEEIE